MQCDISLCYFIRVGWGKTPSLQLIKYVCDIILRHNVQIIQCLLAFAGKHIFYKYAQLFVINPVAIEMKNICWKMLKWAFVLPHTWLIPWLCIGYLFSEQEVSRHDCSAIFN